MSLLLSENNLWHSFERLNEKCKCWWSFIRLEENKLQQREPERRSHPYWHANTDSKKEHDKLCCCALWIFVNWTEKSVNRGGSELKARRERVKETGSGRRVERWAEGRTGLEKHYWRSLSSPPPPPFSVHPQSLTSNYTSPNYDLYWWTEPDHGWR